MRGRTIFLLGVLLAFPPVSLASHQSIFCPKVARGLLFGSRGAEVSELQKFLSSDHEVYPEGIISGFFGPLTKKAVERFQAHHGIVSSGTSETTGYGVVGPKTRAKIAEVCGKSQPEKPRAAPPAELPPVPLPHSTPPQVSNQPLTGPTLPHLAFPEPPKAEPPFMDLKADGSNGPIKVESGSSVTLSWTLSDHKWWYCGKLQGWSGSLISPTSTSEVVSNITHNATFKLACYLGNQAYEDSVSVEAVPKAVVALPSPAPTPAPTPAAQTGLYTGAFGKVTCLARVRPSVVYLDQPPIEAIWEVESSPIERHIYWRETVDGADKGYIYWGKTDRSLAEQLPAKPVKIARQAYISVDSRHAPDIFNPKPPEDVCITNTVEVEVKKSKSSSLSQILTSVFDAFLRYFAQY